MPDIIKNIADNVISCTKTGTPEPNTSPKYTNLESGSRIMPEKPSET